MTPTRWREIERVYHAALERAPADRAGFLTGISKNDPELRREVESLLAQDASKIGTLDRPAWALVSPSDGSVNPITPGIQLGPYKIEGPLGEGGMGEVFRGVDTRLGRSVAVKTSREQFSARFDREARAISALNHPNICTLYDVGPNYLVMELCEGETVAARLEHGKLSIRETIRYGAQIADALAAAHSKGIVHRDLKPGNVMLTKAGVKVLDFGLAKSAQDETLTASQVVMGTPAYMAPEQREGKQCDARTDIYALGLIVYEMASGKRWRVDQPAPLGEFPLTFAHVVERCLEQDPEDRWQSARDVQRELEWGTSSMLLPQGAQERPSARHLWLPFVALVATVVFAAVVFMHFREVPPQRQHVKFQIDPPEGFIDGFKLSPDGRFLALRTSVGSAAEKIWVRSLDGLDTRLLTDRPGLSFGTLFWSQDGEHIAFQLADKLYKIARNGGPPIVLTDAPLEFLGGAWLDSDTIVFGTPNGLFRVSSSGGAPVKIDDQRAELPAWLPGRRFLYGRANGVFAGSLDGGEPIQILSDGTAATYVSPRKPGSAGHLLFVRGDTLMAQAFNADKLELRGNAIPVATHVAGLTNYAVRLGNAFTASLNGVLALGGSSEDVALTWVDRGGKRLRSAGKPFRISRNAAIRLSPDDSQAIVPIAGENRTDMWVADFNRNTFSRFTFNGSNSGIWSPDGKKVLWAARDGNRYLKSADGSGEDELLFKNPTLDTGYVMDWSSDGKLIAVAGLHEKVLLDIWLVPTAGGQPYLYKRSAFATYWAQFSPDNRWMAYGADQTPLPPEIFVESIPAGRGNWQISIGGGDWPIWRRDGRELFYRHGRNLMVVPIRLTERSVEIGAPQTLFEMPASAQRFQVSRDGQRFLVVVPVDGKSTSTPLTVDTDWEAGLRQ